MKYLWINGWGVPPEWIEGPARAGFPNDEHRVVPADPKGDWKEDRFRSDRLIGYSLGAFLLIREELRAPSGRPIGLLAPFFAFQAEAGLGGRVSLTRLRYLRRWLRRDPAAALRDFYQRAGLEEPADRAEPSPPANRTPGTASAPLATQSGRTLLETGLDVLIEDSLPPECPDEAIAFAGDNDALLDARRLRIPYPRLTLLPGRGHHPAPLIEALAGQWNR